MATDILTPRLRLRPVRDSDDRGMHGLRSRPEIMKWSITRTPDPSLSATRAHLARWNEPYNLLLVVLRRDSVSSSSQSAESECRTETGVVDGIIGSVGFFVGEHSVELGYIMHPSVWGQGFATEAVRAAMEAWWEGYGGAKEAAGTFISGRSKESRGMEVRALRAETYPGNEPSYRVLQKCGFTRVGVERDEDGEFEVWMCER